MDKLPPVTAGVISQQCLGMTSLNCKVLAVCGQHVQRPFHAATNANTQRYLLTDTVT